MATSRLPLVGEKEAGWINLAMFRLPRAIICPGEAAFGNKRWHACPVTTSRVLREMRVATRMQKGSAPSWAVTVMAGAGHEAYTLVRMSMS